MPARESTTAFSTSGSPIKAAKTFAAHLAIRWQLSQAGAPLAAALASLVENLLMRSTTPPNRVPALIPARVRETRDRVIVAEVWSLANCSPRNPGMGLAPSDATAPGQRAVLLLLLRHDSATRPLTLPQTLLPAGNGPLRSRPVGTGCRS